ncbi:MAG: DUF2785 domain-containing protein [Anaerolineaceae bacterium]|nr:DUF2785 domain-containing protein [Anaerolineaceae bacterium]
MNENLLKDLLKSVVENEFEPPTTLTPREFLPYFYKHIGSTDAELRDDLIFSVMANWIYKGVYSHEQIFKIADTLIKDEFILNGLGFENDDSVFIRSASASQLWAIIVTHREKNFVPFNTIETIFEKTLRLLKEEVDFRAYVPDSGWANSISHSANIFYELIKLPEINKSQLVMILNAICEKILQPDFIFPGDESEQLAAPVAEILLSETLLEEDIMPSLNKLKIEPHFHGQEPSDFFRLINVRNFLRAIYFSLLDVPDKRRSRDLVLLALQELKSE